MFHNAVKVLDVKIPIYVIAKNSVILPYLVHPEISVIYFGMNCISESTIILF
eukprot:TRINITY_DN4646_c0_g1_i1.p3 TRINITY_DN4646_c0_g1~~TRINITY_DN4646_c0_g1_i1.p3  ORF type:complete len:52 (-),score=3.00 TRINITY_DN4646_c0_g1_i1:275-430(-)